MKRSGLWVAAYGLLLLALAVQSTAYVRGDSREYREMAEALARLAPPAYWVHFWLYPAFVAPVLALVTLVDGEISTAFTIVNVALLIAAFWMAAGTVRWPVLLLVFVSPVLWWSDKAHTEAFTFAWLAIAVAILAVRRRDDQGGDSINPAWAVVAVGIVAAQNPPAVALLPLAAAAAFMRSKARSRTFWLLCAAAIVIASINPIYYLIQVGNPLPLSYASHGKIPNLDEYLTVVRDLNLGLAPNAPFLALAIALAIVVVTLRAPGRWLDPDLAFSAVAILVLLAVFAQTTNVNHGATPGPSRYGMWLIPFALPLLRLADDVSRVAGRRAIGTLACVSAVWSVAVFHPRQPDGPVGPSIVADWVWRNHPALDRPIPEVFIERRGELDSRWYLPATTLGCEKILLLGLGDGQPRWPVPCVPAPAPAACAAEKALCYANRQGATYQFAQVPEPSHWAFALADGDVWSHEETAVMGDLFERWRWWEMDVCDYSPEAVVRSAAEVYGVHHYCAPDRLIVYVREPREGALLRMRLPARMSGEFLGAETAEHIESVSYSGEPGELWEVRVPTDRGPVVLAMSEGGNGVG